ncbi:MAG: sulfite exporter TauE/SafE family protein, partial [Anaerolineales bacterium]
MSELLFYVLIFVVALVYSSAGFGGASGYLLVMGFFHAPPQVMSSMALILNVIVSTISFWNYFRAGHFRPRLLLPFLATSIPAAFVGGMVTLEEQRYFMLLYAVLTYLALRMLFFPVTSERADWKARPFPLWVALVSGALIGLLSGVVGIGGGIFLSPLIILAGWGSSKQAVASSAAFIAIN